jgi:hypothetical protein
VNRASRHLFVIASASEAIQASASGRNDGMSLDLVQRLVERLMVN